MQAMSSRAGRKLTLSLRSKMLTAKCVFHVPPPHVLACHGAADFGKPRFLANSSKNCCLASEGAHQYTSPVIIKARWKIVDGSPRLSLKIQRLEMEMVKRRSRVQGKPTS